MTVLLTGATAASAARIARAFVARGHRVIATGRRQSGSTSSRTSSATRCSRDRSTARARRRPGARRCAARCVVRDRRAREQRGLGLGLDPAQSASLDDWDAMIDTNVKGLVYLTRACLRA